jgi:hypothetical protein
MMTQSVTETDSIQRYLDAYVKDDAEATKHLELVGFSSFTNDPQNLGVMAKTSEGKTYAITRVMDLFPNALKITGQTAKALFYENGAVIDTETGEEIEEKINGLKDELEGLEGSKNSGPEKARLRAQLRGLQRNAGIKVNLSHRILVFLDSPEAALWNALKPLLSHDSWTSWYISVNKGAGSGRSKTEKILLEGWPTCIFASARNEDAWAIWPEIQSRFTIISPNAEPEKYLHANELTARLKGRPTFLVRDDFPESLLEDAKREVRRIKEEMLAVIENPQESAILNPFADAMARAFPHQTGVSMRVFKRLISYSGLLALRNLDRRTKLRIEGKVRAIVVTAEDMKRTLDLIGTNSNQVAPERKHFYEKVILPLSGERPSEWKNSPEGYCSLTEMTKYSASHYRAVGRDSIEKWVMAIEEAGLLTREENPDDKRSFLFSPIGVEGSGEGRLSESRVISESGIFTPQTALESLRTCSDAISEKGGVFEDEHGETVSSLEGLAQVLCQVIPSDIQSEHGIELRQPEGVSKEPDSDIVRRSDNLSLWICATPGCGCGPYTGPKDEAWRGHRQLEPTHQELMEYLP